MKLNEEQKQRVEDHIKLARTITKKYRKKFPYLWEEFESASMLALIGCSIRYKEDMKIPFKKYAARRIRGSIKDVQRQQVHVFADGRMVHIFWSGGIDAYALKKIERKKEHRIICVNEEKPIKEDDESFFDSIKNLSDIEKTVLIGIYKENKGQKLLGKELGLTQNRISQIHSKALGKVKEGYVKNKNKEDIFESYPVRTRRTGSLSSGNKEK